MRNKSQNKQLEIELFKKCVKNSSEYNVLTNEYCIYLKTIFLRKILPNKIPGIKYKKFKILEAGCGTGTFADFFLEFNPNFEIVGVDIVSGMVDLANAKNIQNYHTIQGDLEDSNLFNNNCFDIILCPFILHHFPCLDKVFANLTKWLKVGGFIIILEPNGSNPIRRLSELTRRFIEFIFPNFIIEHKLATPNETSHSVSTYMKFLQKGDYKILFFNTKHFYPENNKKTYSPNGNVVSIMWKFRNILYKIFNHLPSPYKGNNIIIIAIRE